MTASKKSSSKRPATPSTPAPARTRSAISMEKRLAIQLNTLIAAVETDENSEEAKRVIDESRELLKSVRFTDIEAPAQKIERLTREISVLTGTIATDPTAADKIRKLSVQLVTAQKALTQ